MSPDQHSSDTKSTILFVHGAWDNGSAWDLVRDLLEKNGYPTVAPSLPSAGGRPPISSHVKDAEVVRHELQRLVFEEGKEVIAVGHSYGGFVVTESLRGFEKISDRSGGVTHCLVMSSFIGCKGDSIMSFFDHKLSESMPPQLLYGHCSLPIQQPKNPAYVILKGVETAFFSDVDPALASSRIAVAQPHSYATFNSPAVNPCWSPVLDSAGDHYRLPLTYLICSGDQGIPEKLQRSMIARTAEKGGAKWTVWKCNAGHNPAVSHPETVCYAVRKVAGEILGPESSVEITEES